MDSMDLDHDMDIDIDLVPDEPIIPEPDHGSRSPGEIDDGEVQEEPDARAPTKVFLQGLDLMNPDDVKGYVAEHCSEYSLDLERIEWIDDNSASLRFASSDMASHALAILSAEPISDISNLHPRHLLPAKSYSKKPEVILQIRAALDSDKKQAGAASRSRFYLLNPKYDPEERRRNNETRRYRDRDGVNFSRGRRRSARADEGDDMFDVNLYDDSYVASTPPTRARLQPRRSHTPDSEPVERRANLDPYRPLNRGKELFPISTSPRQGTSRDRSASPARYRDATWDRINTTGGDSVGMYDRNRSRAHAIKSHIGRQNRARELFPTEAGRISENGRLGDRVEDAAALLAKGITLPLMDGSSDMPGTHTASRKLGDRIVVPGNGTGKSKGKGKLADRVTSPGSTGSSTFNIRGSASQISSNAGFAIKGSASKTVRELFPDKFGSNTGKELFEDGAGGRPRQRQKAGDLFD
ncbi:hypothetical protein GGS20DRAFT_589821 [Poronia punctata]|nr:hypothetical protein GGS20DRAFT_589821 [Poronia punctata]